MILNGQELIRTEQEVLGYRFQKIIGRDIYDRFIFRVVDCKHQPRSVKVVPVTSQTLDATYREALFCLSFNSEHTVKIEHFIVREAGKQLIIFMEYCESSLAQEFVYFNINNIMKYALDILQCIDFCHSKLGIVHGDIRMESFQLKGQQKKLKIAFHCLDGPMQVDRITYKAPETRKLGFNQPVVGTFHSDIWSLGLMLIELFSLMRIPQIFHINDYNHTGSRQQPAFSYQNFANLNILFGEIKYQEVIPIIRYLLKDNPLQRPPIKQIKRMFKELAGKRFHTEYKISRQGQGQGQGFGHYGGKRREEKYQEIVHKNAETVSQVLLDHSDQKSKSLNLINQKISRIDQKLCHYQNLQWLYLDDNHIQKLENLQLPRLKGLSLSQNSIEKLENLGGLTVLEQLYIENNKIAKMEGLNQLRNLKCFYLGGNRIRFVEGYQFLTALRTLVLTNNQIEEQQERNANALAELRMRHVEVTVSMREDKDKERNRRVPMLQP